jgi:hypothetical protein
LRSPVDLSGLETMTDLPTDIYSEPRDIDVDTLAKPGPLRGMAGIWQGTRRLDVNPQG